jgi:glycosyltransferase involved in cell wall biosynthesis
MESPPHISVVIPVHNEAAHVEPVYRELRAVLEGLNESWEIVVVNDGSSDDTLERLRALQADDRRVRVIDLDGNFGEAAALTAGFHAARGAIIVTMDGDGQNDPADIPALLRVLAQPGITVVSGRRVERQESSLLRVWPSHLANVVIGRVTGLVTHDCGCGLKAYRREALPHMHLPRGMNRFLPAVFGVPAAAFAEVATTDRPRRSGASHYDLRRVIIVLRDLLALPFILRDARRAEVVFALSTAATAGLGALLMPVSHAATLASDAAAVLCGLVWWNARRFNRTQTDGAYRIRAEYSCISASD